MAASTNSNGLVEKMKQNADELYKESIDEASKARQEGLKEEKNLADEEMSVRIIHESSEALIDLVETNPNLQIMAQYQMKLIMKTEKLKFQTTFDNEKSAIDAKHSYVQQNQRVETELNTTKAEASKHTSRVKEREADQVENFKRVMEPKTMQAEKVEKVGELWDRVQSIKTEAPDNAPSLQTFGWCTEAVCWRSPSYTGPSDYACQ
ncbi:hypothetical protein BJ878DRAFT_553033 [Calycina marina]|uniref:Uncharacterized protein n=1 Tax=Calycina marina TaxID=1763456 RepID=A0A9P7Z0H2_9HELO|nr:hypothetical protein BJ878DRAFT_553033 [Calycina marina]